VLVLEHLVHVVAIFLFSATIILGNLRINFFQVLTDELVQIRQVLELVKLILRFLEVLLQIDSSAFSLLSKLLFTVTDFLFKGLETPEHKTDCDHE